MLSSGCLCPAPFYQVVAAIGTLAFYLLNFIGGGDRRYLWSDITHWLALNGRVAGLCRRHDQYGKLNLLLVVIAAFSLLSVWRLQAVRENSRGGKKY